MATSEERDTKKRGSAFGQRVEMLGSLGDLAINKGAIVALNDSGQIVPATDTAGLRPLGRAELSVPALAGRSTNQLSIPVTSGIFELNVDGSLSGDTCFLTDDETVAASGTADFALLVVEDNGSTAYVRIDPFNNAAE